jgi:tRNA(Ile)-lysidine synthase
VDLIGSVAAAIRTVVGANRDPSFLVAVSGGPDSVALLDVMARLARPLGLGLAVAHVNYRLRGEESDEDALFVRDLAGSYGLPFAMKTLSATEGASRGKRGLQEWARTVRYGFFEDVCRRDGYRFLALGHQRGDQLETFFANLFRGAGPDGLRGMRLLSDRNRVRPLLDRSREEIVAYLKARCLPYRVDASNANPAFLRSRLRHDLVARIGRDYGPAATRHVAHAMEILRAEAELVDRIARRDAAEVLSRAAGEPWVTLSVEALRRFPLALQRRFARIAAQQAGMRAVPSFALVERLVWLALSAPSGTTVSLGRGLEARRMYGRVLLGLLAEPEDPLKEVQLSPGARLTVTEWGIRVDVDEVAPAAVERYDSAMFHGDRRCVRFPLALRRARTGDRIAPLGLGGHTKSVSRIFKDAKVPIVERRRALVLSDRERLLWVVGRVVSEACRVAPDAPSVVRIRVERLDPPD